MSDNTSTITQPSAKRPRARPADDFLTATATQNGTDAWSMTGELLTILMTFLTGDLERGNFLYRASGFYDSGVTDERIKTLKDGLTHALNVGLENGAESGMTVLSNMFDEFVNADEIQSLTGEGTTFEGYENQLTVLVGAVSMAEGEAISAKDFINTIGATTLKDFFENGRIDQNGVSPEVKALSEKLQENYDSLDDLGSSMKQLMNLSLDKDGITASPETEPATLDGP